MQIQHRDRDRSQGLLSRVYHELWDQFIHRRAIFSERWAIKKTFNNFARLADAMSTIEVDDIEEIIYNNYWVP